VISDLNIFHNSGFDVFDALSGTGMSELTEKERQNFASLLCDADLVDKFRRLYPNEKKRTYYNTLIRKEAITKGKG